MDKNEKKKTIVLDLRHVMAEESIDTFTEIDLSKQIGNLIHRNAGDIGLDDKARELYHNGTVEVDMSTFNMFKAIVTEAPILLYCKNAILKEMNKAIEAYNK